MSETGPAKISKFQAWILASRPKTLLAAFMPVIVGTAIAISDGAFNFLAALDALVCSLLIQIGTNFSNDLFDYLAGTDAPGRVGPKRALAEGWLSVREMKTGIALTFGVTFLLGLYLVHLGGWVILVVGVLSILAGLAYTAGPLPLAYNGLGDLFAFVFFGLVGTIGTYYVQALRITPVVIWSSIPVGALVTNILIVNNYRDIEEDKRNGKKTLAVILGRKLSRLQFILLTAVSFLTPFVIYFFYRNNYFVFLPLLSLPLGIKLIKMLYTLEGEALNKTLELTAKLSGIFGLLFALGLLL